MISHPALRSLAVVLVAACLALATGCTTSETAKALLAQTGFLTTYEHLEPRSAASMGYLNPANRLAQYDKFIVLPIELRMYGEQKDVSEAEVNEIKTYLHAAIVRELSTRYQVLPTATWDTAKIRIAVTDITKSAPILNVIPRPKITNLGLGGLSMEGEVLDSVSAVQIAALIESRTGQNRGIDFSQLDDTKTVMDEWARRLRIMVDEAHGYPVTDG